MTFLKAVIAVSILAAHLPQTVNGAEVLKLRKLGAVGDGKTDDRAAIEAALKEANGVEIDGEGATYAVHGNIELATDIYLRNATFIQTMGPVDISKYIPSARGGGRPTVEPPDAFRTMVGSLPYLHASGFATYTEDPVLSDEEVKAVLPSISLRTLSVTGSKGKPVSVRLENIKVMMGSHPENGGGDAGGICVRNASPVVMTNIEVTGNGKGCGILVRDSAKVKLEGLNIHDIVWVPYKGDNIYEVATLKGIKEDFGWNNFPIYEFNVSQHRFGRVRIQEQLSGLMLLDCNDVQLLKSKISNLQTKIGDRLYPLQADGVTVNRGSNITVRDCQFARVWEGIDFTGFGGDEFHFEDCTAEDTFTFGFKLAHPKQNGMMVNCIAHRSGNAGFVMEPEMENVQFVRCAAFETGSNGYWSLDDAGRRLMTIGGFKLATNPALPTPLRVKFDHCKAINRDHPGAMDFGFQCDGGINPAERQIELINCVVEGALVQGIHGFAPEN